MRLIVGLGNPGRAYARHRHNIGFRMLEMFAERQGIALQQKSFGAIVGEGQVAGEKILLLKPQDFMNRSGVAVKAAAEYYRVAPATVMVIHDDLDVELGRLKFGVRLGDGGHNGVKSVIAELGSKDFCRVRAGIGRPPATIDPADYVLSPFSKEERARVERMVDQGTRAIEDVLVKGLAFVQHEYHTKSNQEVDDA